MAWFPKGVRPSILMLIVYSFKNMKKYELKSVVLYQIKPLRGESDWNLIVSMYKDVNNSRLYKPILFNEDKFFIRKNEGIFIEKVLLVKADFFWDSDALIEASSLEQAFEILEYTFDLDLKNRQNDKPHLLDHIINLGGRMKNAFSNA